MSWSAKAPSIVALAKLSLERGICSKRLRVEANNAKGKYIERMFGKMRNNKEKYAEGWIARPFAKSEANQAGKGATKIIPIMNSCRHALLI